LLPELVVTRELFSPLESHFLWVVVAHFSDGVDEALLALSIEEILEVVAA
jgi:hypothetical protein